MTAPSNLQVHVREECTECEGAGKTYGTLREGGVSECVFCDGTGYIESWMDVGDVVRHPDARTWGD